MHFGQGNAVIYEFASLSLHSSHSVRREITRAIASRPAMAYSVWERVLDSVVLCRRHEPVPSYFLVIVHVVPIFR